MPIILVANKSKRINKDRTTVPPNKVALGYRGGYPATRSLLLAQGPAFKKSHTVDSLPLIEVHTLLCATLKLDSCSKGSKTVAEMFRKPNKWYVVVYNKVTSSTTNITIAAIVALVLLFIAIYLVVFSTYRACSRCRWWQVGGATRNVEVNTPMKFPKPTFRNITNSTGEVAKSEKEAKLHLLEDSEVSDLEEDLHFQYHNEVEHEPHH